jgi:uncharacterized cupredoxin-like copper-binding protein
MKRVLLIVGTVGLLGLAACGSDPAATEGSGAGSSGMPDMSRSGEPMMTGQPGTPGEVDTTVRVSQLDELAFDPTSIDVRAGETVEFVVTNEGAIGHEFVLGNESFQAAHEDEMAGMSGLMPDEPNALSLAPGQTKRLIWTFTEPGSLLYGCHVPGHYPAGMVGEIVVAG